MSTLSGNAAHTAPTWFPKVMLICACGALALTVSSWCCSVLNASTEWAPLLSGVAAFLAVTAYALYADPRPNRLLLFGRDKVQVRSLDEWTRYQYDVPFEAASPDQQKEALNHYNVGLRLFPARPQDRQQRPGAWHWILGFIVFNSFLTLSESMRGWYRLLLFAGFSGLFWLCMRLARTLSRNSAVDA